MRQVGHIGRMVAKLIPSNKKISSYAPAPRPIHSSV